MLIDADEVELIILCRAEIKATDVLVNLIGLYGAVRKAVDAGVSWGNIRLDQIDGDRIKRADGDLAVRFTKAGRPRCDARDAAGNADGGGYDIFGEGSSGIVTGQLRRREDSNVAISGAVKAAGLGDCLTCTLIREEEEELVLKEGSANRSSEDVLVECWCGLSLLQEVVRVQKRVALE